MPRLSDRNLVEDLGQLDERVFPSHHVQIHPGDARPLLVPEELLVGVAVAPHERQLGKVAVPEGVELSGLRLAGIRHQDEALEAGNDLLLLYLIESVRVAVVDQVPGDVESDLLLDRIPQHLHHARGLGDEKETPPPTNLPFHFHLPPMSG